MSNKDKGRREHRRPGGLGQRPLWQSWLAFTLSSSTIIVILILTERVDWSFLQAWIIGSTTGFLILRRLSKSESASIASPTSMKALIAATVSTFIVMLFLGTILKMAGAFDSIESPVFFIATAMIGVFGGATWVIVYRKSSMIWQK